MLNYGDKAKDKITGFEGVVTAHISYYGMRPDQYILESMTKEGYTYRQSVDENRLIPANKGVALVNNVNGAEMPKATRVHLCEG